MKEKRKRGYYWVRIRNSGLHVVASFTGKEWFIPGNSTMWKESLFEKIDENRIILPDHFLSDYVKTLPDK